MNLPKHPREIEASRQAIAPYNFVELPDRVVTIDPHSLPPQDRFHPDRLTGEYVCELTTASPVYIRAGLSPEDYEAGFEAKDQPAFFYTHRPDEPVIPGSSLRGMIRSLVEVASYSKISAVTNDSLVFRMVGDGRYRNYLMHEDQKNMFTPLFRAGYLHKIGSEWFIHPAQMINGVTWARIRSDPELFRKLRPHGKSKNASIIYVSVSQPQYQPIRGGFISIYHSNVIQTSDHPAPGLTEMVLTKSGFIASKRSEVVVFPVDLNERIHISDELIERYRDQLTPAQRQLLGSNGVLIDGKKDEQVMQPVFYLPHPSKPDQIFFFGHCRLFRIPYPHTPLDLIPKDLRDEDQIDLTEAIFGYTKKKPEDKTRNEQKDDKPCAYAGRVNFSDAHLEPDQKDLWLEDKPTILKILSGAKPTTFQHYLVQPEPGKYIIGKTKDGKPKFELRLRDYTNATSQTVLRGHKFYWQKGNVSRDEIAESAKVEEDDTQHTRVRPLRSGVKFTFYIRFENLSMVELGALQWLFNIGSDDKVRFKLGMGKPLGMGAVGVKAQLRLRDATKRYTKLLNDSGWEEGWLEQDETDVKASLAVTAFEQFVINSLGYTQISSLTKIERIQQLIMLLSWPGPDPAYTRYMEIEHYDPQGGKVNEYKERPVLPLPKVVWAKKRPITKATISHTPDEIPAGFIRGIVTRFGLGAAASFGFILPDGSDKEIFVHNNDLAPGLSTLQQGQHVIFRVVMGAKGNKAVDVQLDNTD